MSRNCSRSFSSADEYPHDPSPRTECPALYGTTLVCMWILMSNFNSLPEDHPAHNELISMAIVPVMSLLQIVWISLPRVLILLKWHHFGISRFFRDI